MLRELDRDLWVAEQPLRFAGIEVGCRMTVVRLEGGRLVLHSPIAISQILRAEVSGLGRPGWLVAPNRFHHLFIGTWADAFPDCELLLTPGLRSKRSDLTDTAFLDAGAPAEWRDELALFEIEGLPMMGEYVLLHRPTGTLVISDLAFNIDPGSPLSTRILFGLAGRIGELAPTVMEKLLTRDRAAFRRSLERILAEPFDRVVVAHGNVVEAGGRAALAKGYDWLLA